jgi:hypothetical protein
VTVKDVKLAHKENFTSVEHLKRYTTLGMATDQGKTGNVIGLAVMAELTGRHPGNRDDDLPPALYAGGDGHAGGAVAGQRVQALPPDAAIKWASEQGAIFRRGRQLAASAMAAETR